MRTYEALNKSTPTTVDSLLQKVKFGHVLRQCVKQTLLKQVPTANASLVRPQVSTLNAIELPDHAKAGIILRAYARAGTVSGELTVAAPNATPTTGQIAVAPNGDIVMLAADAITLVDVEYIPAGPYEVVTLTDWPVSSDALAIPEPYKTRGVLACIAATATTATTAGKKRVLASADSAPATTLCKLGLLKETVLFPAADAVTAATVVLAVALPSADMLPTALDSDSPTF